MHRQVLSFSGLAMENHRLVRGEGDLGPFQNAQKFLGFFGDKTGVAESIQGLPLLGTFRIYRLSSGKKNGDIALGVRPSLPPTWRLSQVL